jgi:hypothetical protein
MMLKASTFCEYFCIPLQPPLPYVNQSTAHITMEDYQDICSCEQYGHMTEGY